MNNTTHPDILETERNGLPAGVTNLLQCDLCLDFKPETKMQDVRICPACIERAGHADIADHNVMFLRNALEDALRALDLSEVSYAKGVLNAALNVTGEKHEH